MAKNGITAAEVTAFAERIKDALANAEADRKTVLALQGLLRTSGPLGRGAAGAGRGTRASSEAVQNKVLQALKGERGGAQLGTLVDATRFGRNSVQRALQRLRRAGSVKMVGKKRLAKYHAV